MSFELTVFKLVQLQMKLVYTFSLEETACKWACMFSFVSDQLTKSVVSIGIDQKTSNILQQSNVSVSSDEFLFNLMLVPKNVIKMFHYWAEVIIILAT